MTYQCKSPVLFLVFNRPEVTGHVFEAIRQAKPSKLYVAADGPRADREEEAKLCWKVREIATAVDWDCDVKTLFRDQNLGCCKAVSEAINWFFENVEKGIILEDDCLPHLSFFEYCDLMLEKYRKDESIWSVAGTKFKCYPYSRKSLGYKSEIFFCWGWATWQDRWKSYTEDLDELLPIEEFSSSKAFKYWSRVIESLKNNTVDSWDYKNALLLIKYSKKNILPPCNLVRNIGFGSSFTHTAKPPRHYTSVVKTFKSSCRNGISNASIYDDIYYGLHHQIRLVKFAYVLLMYGINFYEKIFNSIHSKK